MHFTVKKILHPIANTHNHFLVKVKANQPKLLKALKDTITQGQPIAYLECKETNRGRIESRIISVFDQKELLPTDWHIINRIILVTRQVSFKNKSYKHHSIYITDLETNNAKYLLNGIRGHWYIENKLHYTKDVILREDRTATKNKIAAANLSIFRNFCFNILKTKHKSIKLAIEFFSNNNLKVLFNTLSRT